MGILKEVIEEHPFFRDVGTEYVEHLAATAEAQTYRSGEYVLRDGEPADRVYLVTRGKIDLGLACNGKANVTIQALSPGDVIGWSWIVPPHQWRFDAMAAEDVDVISLDAKYLRSQCKKDRDLGYTILSRVNEVVAQRLSGARDRIIQIYRS